MEILEMPTEGIGMEKDSFRSESGKVDRVIEDCLSCGWGSDLAAMFAHKQLLV